MPLARAQAKAAGSVLAFLVVGLLVKYAELLFTVEHRQYIQPQGTVISRVLQAWLSLRFSWQEFAVAGLLLAGVVGYSRWQPAPGRIGQAVLTVLRAFLAVTSLISVFGISYYAVYHTHFSKDDFDHVGFAPHLLASTTLFSHTSVMLGVATWVVATFGLPLWVARWPAVRAARLATVAVAGLAGLSVVTWAAGRPNLAEARLEPHPVVWMLAGERVSYANLPPAGEIAPIGPRERALEPSERPRNIILIALESTPALAVSVYNPEAEGGRRMFAEFGNDATVFTDVFSVLPTSTAGLVSVLLGRSPMPSPAAALADAGGIRTLGEELQSHGFQTQFLFNGPTDAVRTALRERGFDRALMLDRDWPGRENYPQTTWGYDDRLLFDTGRAFLQEQTKDSAPFFLMLHSNNAHHPYSVDHLPGGDALVDAKAKHRALVNQTLELVTDLYAWLKRSGLADTTAVIVYGDHGEAFGEHSSNFIHSKELYVENVHVPMWILHPRRLGLPPRVDQLGSLDDVTPTILDLLGYAAGDRDGMSLLDRAPERVVVSMTDWGPGQIALRDRRYSYMLSRTGRELLFDRVADPAERSNLAGSLPDVAARFRARLLATK